MKKTFKKQFILLAVVAVMMMLALVIPASAAENRCPAANGGAHSSEFVEKLVYAPTCTQDGYSIMAYCTECKEIVVGAPYEDEVTEKTGHNYKVYYEEDTVNGGFMRVRECTNPLCQRYEVKADGTVTAEEIIGSKDVCKDYYLVEFKNTYEAPEKTDPNHSAYYDIEFYDVNSPVTWLATSYTSKIYEVSKNEAVNAADAEPDYEIIAEADGLKLYVKGGKKAPAYEGTVPMRGKDTSYGAYGFSSWNTSADGSGVNLADAQAINENTTFFACFKGITDRTEVSFTFCNWDGALLTSRTKAEYGSLAEYGDLNPPSRANDERSWYEFDGWTVGKDGKVVYNDNDEIRVYYDVSIYAHYAEHKNYYTVKYVNNNGDELEVDGEPLVSENVLYGRSLAEDINKLPNGALDVPRDKKYIYTFEDQWEIVKINDREVAKSYTVNSHSLVLPKTVYVYDEDGNTMGVVPSDKDVITLAPKYTKTPVRYTFKVKIVTDNFDKNDVYEGGMTTSAILDKFGIQVTDANGQYVAHGQTDSKGEFYFSALYSDSFKVTAATTNNNKYYGETTLYFATLEQIEYYERIGITIAPAVTAEWDEGIKGCSCICHSVFGGIMVKIYNILYRMFNIRYVCCDDLFIVHGDVLAYTSK